MKNKTNMTDLINSTLLKNILDYKSEINDLQNLLIKLINSNKSDEAEHIQTILTKIIEYDNDIQAMQLELIKRNYGTVLEFKNKKYTPIELLKIKETLIHKRAVYKEVTTSIENSSDKKLLELSLNAFKEFQTIKSDLNELYTILEKYNEGK